MFTLPFILSLPSFSPSPSPHDPIPAPQLCSSQFHVSTSAGTVAEPAPFTLVNSPSPFLSPPDAFPTNDSNNIVFDANMGFPLDPQEMGFSQLVISTGNAFLEEQVQPSSYNHPYYHDGSFNPDAYNWSALQAEVYQQPPTTFFKTAGAGDPFYNQENSISDGELAILFAAYTQETPDHDMGFF